MPHRHPPARTHRVHQSQPSPPARHRPEFPGPFRHRLRMARQETVTRTEDPLEFWTVLNEAAIRRCVGGPAVMREQLRRLADVAELPNVTVQILPYGVGAHAAMMGPFTIVTFNEDGADDVTYLEYAAGSLYLEKRDAVRNYTRAFDDLRASALDPRGSLDLIRRTADTFA
ncbi:DUF5753 domain-containing protein [Sphaerisporangium rubeum]|nr:DUF5753 domain-containing protein [Sphaerisporangium rubeum]